MMYLMNLEQSMALGKAPGNTILESRAGLLKPAVLV